MGIVAVGLLVLSVLAVGLVVGRRRAERDFARDDAAVDEFLRRHERAEAQHAQRDGRLTQGELLAGLPDLREAVRPVPLTDLPHVAGSS